MVLFQIDADAIWVTLWFRKMKFGDLGFGEMGFGETGFGEMDLNQMDAVSWVHVQLLYFSYSGLHMQVGELPYIAGISPTNTDQYTHTDVLIQPSLYLQP